MCDRRAKEDIKESEKKARDGKIDLEREKGIESAGTVDGVECCPGSKAGGWVVDSLCGFYPWGQSSRGECRGAHLDPSKRKGQSF